MSRLPGAITIRPSRSAGRAATITKWLVGLVLGGLLLVLAICIAFVWRLNASKARLDGVIEAPELSAPLTVFRDSAGVATIVGVNRSDVAFATGYLHAQERFFQMDQLRRAAAGELGDLFGEAARDYDKEVRVHRFRARARAAVKALSPAESEMLRAYADGVNRGLRDLQAPPFEYALLRSKPRPWSPEDSILVVFAMYLVLQEGRPKLDLEREQASLRVGPAMANFLYPVGTELDAPLDGSHTLPVLPPPDLKDRAGAVRPSSVIPIEPVFAGSNAWAVSGRFTATGAAMVANDMHLDTSIPNTWYRLRVIVRPSRSDHDGLDITGVTLPGMFPIVVGSNGFVAWGFTASYIDTHDAIFLDLLPGRSDWYKTPYGPRQIQMRNERICASGKCENFTVRETIWGPIVGRIGTGAPVVDRWVAHDAGAVTIAPMLALERARTVDQALLAAQEAAIPNQNFIVGDRTGNIAWTIMGRIPRRFGTDGKFPSSWASGQRGWNGFLDPKEVPRIVNPPSGRIWSANNRMMGGKALAVLGDGGYDDGTRARRIAALLFSRQQFSPKDMLRIQLDIVSLRAPFWRDQLLAAIQRRRSDPRLSGIADAAKKWDGRASTDSIGYRLIRSFRALCISSAYAAYLGGTPDQSPNEASSEQPMRQLLRSRPEALTPPGYTSWDAFENTVLSRLADSVERSPGGLEKYTWGAYMHADIHHPLAGFVPGLGRLTDPPDRAMPGDGGVPRAQYIGAGASERLVVSPGHEAEGLFEMPGGQAGNPWSPYYLAGHNDWVFGAPTSFLPGPARWTLSFSPKVGGDENRRPRQHQIATQTVP